MIGYALYFLLAVGITMILSAAFRRSREQDAPATAEDDAAFERRMAKIEQDFKDMTEGKP